MSTPYLKLPANSPRQRLVVLFGLLLAGCDGGAVEMARELEAARGECTLDRLRESDEECVRMMERYAGMTAELIDGYIGGVRALDMALDRMPPPAFDAEGLGYALSPEFRPGDPEGSGASPLLRRVAGFQAASSTRMGRAARMPSDREAYVRTGGGTGADAGARRRYPARIPFGLDLAYRGNTYPYSAPYMYDLLDPPGSGYRGRWGAGGGPGFLPYERGYPQPGRLERGGSPRGGYDLAWEYERRNDYGYGDSGSGYGRYGYGYGYGYGDYDYGGYYYDRSGPPRDGFSPGGYGRAGYGRDGYGFDPRYGLDYGAHTYRPGEHDIDGGWYRDGPYGYDYSPHSRDYGRAGYLGYPASRDGYDDPGTAARGCIDLDDEYCGADGGSLGDPGGNVPGDDLRTPAEDWGYLPGRGNAPDQSRGTAPTADPLPPAAAARQRPGILLPPEERLRRPWLDD